MYTAYRNPALSYHPDETGTEKHGREGKKRAERCPQRSGRATVAPHAVSHALNRTVILEYSRRIDSLYLLAVSLMVMAAVGGCSMARPVVSFVPAGPLQHEQSYGVYVVRTYRGDTGSYEILRNGVRVHAAQGHFFRIGGFHEDEENTSPLVIGTDITGDGQPNLVVAEWTGGAHCCFLFHLFAIGSQFRLLETIDAGHSDRIDFENLDGDPALEFQVADWTFAYWRTSFADSPAPMVIMKYQGQRYRMALDLMREPGFSPDELDQLAARFKALPDWEFDPPPVQLWSTMLDLIYTGNMDQAWELLERAWPGGISGKEEFLTEFKTQLRTSPFWRELRKLNLGSRYIAPAGDGWQSDVFEVIPRFSFN